jgi:Tfp pilus assembly protein PilF
VRVIPRLTNATTGASLWSQTYDRELDDIFAIRSEIALEVAKALSIELSALERERVERVPTNDSRARELYLRAKAREWRYTRKDELLRAKDEVEQALAIDPEFKEALLLAMSIYAYASIIDWERSETHRLRAEQAARRALELDPELGDPYVPIGALASLEKNWIAAEAAFNSARDRNVPWALLGPYALLRLSAGDFAFGRDVWEQSRAAAPQLATAQRFLAFHYEGLGERARAKALYESAEDLFPDDEREVSQMRVQNMHWLVGRNELVQARSIAVDDPLNSAMLENLDSRQQALEQLRIARAETVAGNHSGLRDIGLWYGHFGEPQLALDAMRAAIDAQGQMMVYLWLPQLAEMRRLPEFRKYMRAIGMVAYWEKYGWPPFCPQPIDQHDFECH